MSVNSIVAGNVNAAQANLDTKTKQIQEAEAYVKNKGINLKRTTVLKKENGKVVMGADGKAETISVYGTGRIHGNRAEVKEAKKQAKKEAKDENVRMQKLMGDYYDKSKHNKHVNRLHTLGKGALKVTLAIPKGLDRLGAFDAK